MRVRFAGFGGQGIVLCGMVFGKAAMLDGKSSIQTQSYGSASRGGLTRADVCIEDGEIYDLGCEEIDVLVALSQQSHDSFKTALLPGGKIFYESHLVQLDPDSEVSSYGADATDIAFKKFGKKIIANMIMMGFVNEFTNAVTGESLIKTVRESVPPGTDDLNISALEAGMELAREIMAKEGR